MSRMSSSIATLLFSVVLMATDFSPSSATTWNVSSDSDLNTANSNAVSGDVIQISNGTYTSYPNPSNSATNGNYFYYVGNLSNPAAVHMPTCSITKPYLSIKGMQFEGSVHMDAAANRDSLYKVNVNGGDFTWEGNDYGVFRWMNCTGPTLWLNYLSGHNSIGNIMEDCRFTIGADYRGGSGIFILGLGGVGTRGRVDSCTFRRNVFDITVPNVSESADIDVFRAFCMRHCTWVNNRWNIDMEWQGNGGETVLSWGLRDSSFANTFVRDTVFSTGPGSSNYLLSHSGSWSESVTDQAYDGCFFKTNGDAANFQNSLTNTSIMNCVFVSRDGQALTSEVMHGTNSICHNTFVGDGQHGVFQSAATSRDAWTGMTTIHNNIFYAIGTAVANQANGDDDHDPTKRYAQLMEDDGKFNDYLDEDYNLFAYYGYADTTGDRCIGLEGGDPGPVGSAPGFGHFWNIWFGQDEHSRYNSPQLQDSSWSTLDPHLRAGSAAGTGKGWPDDYVGALPNDAINDLTASTGRTTAAVAWTAPAGTACAHDTTEIRYSTSSINSGNYYGANLLARVPSGEPGTEQCVSIAGLSSCVTYYFAAMTTYDLGMSELSNLASASTKCSGSLVVDCAGMSLIRDRPVDDAEGPAAVALAIPAPTPSRSSAILSYQIPFAAVGQPIDLSVFDVSGRRVKALLNGQAQIGTHQVAWDLKDAAGRTVRSGVYFVRLQVGFVNRTRTVIVSIP